MPRIGDRVRVRATGRTANITGVREGDETDEYGVVFEDVPAATRAQRASQGDLDDGRVWFTSDELEVIT